MEINGIDVNVKQLGAGKPFIWGHGLTACMKSEDLSGLFSWNDFPLSIKLIRYDARGHGKSGSSFLPQDFHWKNLAKDMISIGDELGIAQFVAGGQSMGCATSIYAGLQAPERVKAMVLMNPPTAWETRSDQGDLYRKMASVGGRLGGEVLANLSRDNLKQVFPGWLYEARKDTLSGSLEGLRHMNKETLKCVFEGAALTDLPTRKEIASIKIPALILAWTDDPAHPVSTAEELKDLLPNTDLHVANSVSEFQSWPELIREFLFKHG